MATHHPAGSTTAHTLTERGKRVLDEVVNDIIARGYDGQDSPEAVAQLLASVYTLPDEDINAAIDAAVNRLCI